LPKGTGHIARRIATFRRFLEQAVADRNGNGDVGKHLMEGALIQTACRWEGVSQLASRWLYLRAESMSDADRATYLRMTAWASERRDVALKALRIDRAECDTIAALYGPGVLQ
jgi:hypothetical protein